MAKKTTLANVLSGMTVSAFEGRPRKVFLLAKVYEDEGWGWSFRVSSGMVEDRLIGVLDAEIRSPLTNRSKTLPPKPSKTPAAAVSADPPPRKC